MFYEVKPGSLVLLYIIMCIVCLVCNICTSSLDVSERIVPLPKKPVVI